MSLITLESLEQIDEFKVLVPPKNHVGLRLGLVCTLFMDKPQSAEVRKNLAICGDEYQKTASGQLKSYFAPSGEYKSIRYPDQGVSLQDYVQKQDSTDKTFSPFFFDTTNYREACAYGLSIMSPGSQSPIQNKPAYISAVLPVSWLKTHAGGLQKLFCTWAARLKPFYGYAGFGALQSLDMVEKKRTRPLLTPLVNRHPGLEVVNPAVVANHILGEKGSYRIKGVNWLTAVSEACLKPLGGGRELIEHLDENFTITEYEAGLVIQAGQMPQLGDRNTQHMPQYYARLSQLLRPLRMSFPGGHSLINGLEGMDNTEASNQWLARFDGV